VWCAVGRNVSGSLQILVLELIGLGGSEIVLPRSSASLMDAVNFSMGPRLTFHRGPVVARAAMKAHQSALRFASSAPGPRSPMMSVWGVSGGVPTLSPFGPCA